MVYTCGARFSVPYLVGKTVACGKQVGEGAYAALVGR
jgi:hypothetical protein